MSSSLCRRLFLLSESLSGPRRSYSTWLRQIFGSKRKTSEEEKLNVGNEAASVSPSEHLRQLVQDHFPDHHTHSDWTTAPLDRDSHLKAKVLLSCERQFNVGFSDRQLGSIRTPQDVLHLISQPRIPVPQTVFPKIECLESLPPNLSVYAASVQSSAKKQVRQPFQNYDSPEHATFLNKQIKEAKKRKRRHLTAIEKRYA